MRAKVLPNLQSTFIDNVLWISILETMHKILLTFFVSVPLRYQGVQRRCNIVGRHNGRNITSSYLDLAVTGDDLRRVSFGKDGA